MQGKTEGIYVLIYADGPVTLPAVVKDRMRLDEAVIRNMVVRLEDPQETEVRATIAEQEVNAGEAEAQRLAAERRAVAAAEAAAMSAAEAEAAAEEASERKGLEPIQPILFDKDNEFLGHLLPVKQRGCLSLSAKLSIGSSLLSADDTSKAASRGKSVKTDLSIRVDRNGELADREFSRKPDIYRDSLVVAYGADRRRDSLASSRPATHCRERILSPF